MGERIFGPFDYRYASIVFYCIIYLVDIVKFKAQYNNENKDWKCAERFQLVMMALNV